MVSAVDRAHEIRADALQVFGDNPTAWKRRNAPPAELDAFRARLAAHDIAPLAIHAAYLINLAGPDDDFYERSLEVLGHELAAGRSYGARFVNVHTGSHRNTSLAAGIERLSLGLARVISDVDDDADAPLLVLENSAGGGGGIGATVAELSDIAEAIAARGIDERRVGFCLDIAHAWAAGHRLSEPDETDALLGEFDRRIGLERLVMIHLNDSKSELGSRLDRHEHVGAGQIGEGGMAHLLLGGHPHGHLAQPRALPLQVQDSVRQGHREVQVLVHARVPPHDLDLEARAVLACGQDGIRPPPVRVAQLRAKAVDLPRIADALLQEPAIEDE